MPIVFNAAEAFEMAQQIERNGARFYRKAADSNPAEASFLRQLADQEDEHLATFTELKNALPDRASESTAHDPDGEGSLYLQAIASGYVFDPKRDPSAILAGNETFQQIATTAIGLEKDSIVFYSGLKIVTLQQLGRDKLDLIIAEELQHIAWLSQKLDSK
ncbi:MAG: rubrerythrin [Lentisphaerales bacterium]|nr:MAG: rubrerythrin [Lentisphaerales bacterium]